MKQRNLFHFFFFGYTNNGDDMHILEMVLLPVFSIIILFILTKMMGYRQITQLSMYDYIIGITIGSIASELSVSSFQNCLQSIIAMLIFGLTTCLLSYITRISKPIRTFIEGHPIVLYEHDQLNCQALKISKLDIDEFLMICRVNGYFNLADLEMIILETNGRFSFYPKTSARVVQYEDLRMKSHDEYRPVELIKEGAILKDNLKLIEKDKTWLEQQLKVKGIVLADIELLYQDNRGNIQYCLKNEKKSYFI